MFDWELDHTLKQPRDKVVFNELREFIRTRYRPLEAQIDSLQKDGQMAFVVIICHDDGAIETQGFNIPTHLTDKLKDCITESDMNHVINVIGRKIQDQKNKNQPGI